jgi:hypothetical protein
LVQELERSGSNNMSRAGSLGFENAQFINSVIFWHADYASYVVNMDFVEQLWSFKWCKSVSNRDAKRRPFKTSQDGLRSHRLSTVLTQMDK